MTAAEVEAAVRGNLAEERTGEAMEKMWELMKSHA